MAKHQFYPLDITYKVINNKPVIHLFGRTTDNKQICVTDENFQPYFYVIPKKGHPVDKKLEKIKVETNNTVAEVTKTQNIKKIYMGKEVNAIKVFTKLPRDVPIIRETIKKWTILDSINEYDIPFTKRYLIDKQITPLILTDIEGDFIKQNIKTPVFKAEKIEQTSDRELKEPKILAFDIETYNPEGKEIDTEKNPILMISFYSKNLKKVITWKKFKKKGKYIEFVNSEAELIERFKETINAQKPDILTGYFSDGFDLPYIKARAKKYKINLDLGLDYSEIKTLGKATSQSKITGLTHIDIFQFIKKIVSSAVETESYSLNAVAEELLGQKKQEVELEQLAHVWDKEPQKLNEFCTYNLTDSKLTHDLTEKMIPNLIELVKIVGLPLFEVSRMGFSQLVESYLLKQAPNNKQIAPNKPHHDEIRQRRIHTYAGGFVYEPKPGLYKSIIVFDYRSLYPTIISSHNIDPGTLCCECCKKNTVPDEKKYWFCTKKKGFIPTIISDLVTRRMRIKEMLDKQKHNIMLEARQYNLKILANAFYGYLGFFAARWYSLECARSVTAYGRYYIHQVIDKAEKKGFKVIYSDTDSLFVLLGNKTKKDADRFCESVNLKLPGLMELEYEGFYPSGIFVTSKASEAGAKKKYALISDKGIIKIRGFETVRRNWSTIAKESQEKVLQIILKENNKEKALKYIKNIISELKKGKIPLEKLIISTQLQKDISSYAAIGPHVAIAKKMKSKGMAVGPGSIIKYVITKGKGRIRDKAKLPEEAKAYDDEYYINNQIIPSVERIFEVLGFKKQDLLEEKSQSKLGKFL